jgi:hypothetical protein
MNGRWFLILISLTDLWEHKSSCMSFSMSYSLAEDALSSTHRIYTAEALRGGLKTRAAVAVQHLGRSLQTHHLRQSSLASYSSFLSPQHFMSSISFLCNI